MPTWNDLGNMWGTLREIDVTAIRTEAEQPLFIACVGSERAVDATVGLLRHTSDRYPGVGVDPLGRFAFGTTVAELERADLLLLAIDATVPLSDGDLAALRRLEALAAPMTAVLFFGERPPAGLAFGLVGAAIVDPTTLGAAEGLAKAVLDRLPGELHLAAARRLPGLRVSVAKNLVNSTSLTNATYALTSSLPEQIPILSVPFALADIFILTKNQALMVYRLGLAYGAPPEFPDRMKEVLPVVGGAFLWRQVARSLVGLIPVWGILPKVAVSYSGTYATGVAAWRWFARGELVNGDQLRQLYDEAMARGREQARMLTDRLRRERKALPAPSDHAPSDLAPSTHTPNVVQRTIDSVRRRLPWGKPPEEPQA